MIDHEYTKEIVCPYCGYEFSNSWEYDGECGEDQCSECDKYFQWTRNVSVDYSTSHACEKNKEEHEWSEWIYADYTDETKHNEVEDYYFRYCEQCGKYERAKLKELQKEN